MARKYITISVNTDVDIEVDDILCKVDTKDILEELDTRIDLQYHTSKLKEIALENCEFDDLELLNLNLIQEMKLKYLLEIIDKYSLDQIESALPK